MPIKNVMEMIESAHFESRRQGLFPHYLQELKRDTEPHVEIEFVRGDTAHEATITYPWGAFTTTRGAVGVDEPSRDWREAMEDQLVRHMAGFITEGLFFKDSPFGVWPDWFNTARICVRTDIEASFPPLAGPAESDDLVKYHYTVGDMAIPVTSSEIDFSLGLERCNASDEDAVVKARMHLQATGLPLLCLLPDMPLIERLDETPLLRDTRFMLPSGDIIDAADACIYLLQPELYLRVHEGRKRIKLQHTTAQVDSLIASLPDATRQMGIDYYGRRSTVALTPPVAGVRTNVMADTATMLNHTLRQLRVGCETETVQTFANGTTLLKMSSQGTTHCQYLKYSQQHLEALSRMSLDERAADFKEYRVHIAAHHNWYDPPLLLSASGSGKTWGAFEELYVDNDHVVQIPYHGLWVTIHLWHRYATAVRAKIDAALLADPPEQQRLIDAARKREAAEALQRRLAEAKRRAEIAKGRARAEVEAAVQQQRRELAARPQVQASSSKKTTVRERQERRTVEAANKVDELAHAADQNADYKAGLRRDKALRQAKEAQARVDEIEKDIADHAREEQRERDAVAAARDPRYRAPAMPTLDAFLKAHLEG